MMIRQSLILLILVFSASCKKTNNAGRIDVDLDITETQTPATANHGTPLVSRVKSYAPNACYRFERMDVQVTASNEYAIHSVGSVERGATVCADVLIQADTTISIPTVAAGQYILRFYNGTRLFKADTVQVN
jgi:hypothetical protein